MAKQTVKEQLKEALEEVTTSAHITGVSIDNSMHVTTGDTLSMLAEAALMNAAAIKQIAHSQEVITLHAADKMTNNSTGISIN
tara:strand:- start:34732 stop:34980 length:249 start_codon:yes stop_codon:yes gene_type:complete